MAITADTRAVAVSTHIIVESAMETPVAQPTPLEAEAPGPLNALVRRVSGKHQYFLPASGEPFGADRFSRPARIAKRVLDLVVVVMLLVLGIPVLILAAVAIKLDSGGPVLFSQQRVGRRGRIFRIVKLRTMFVNNDESAHADYVARLIRGEAEQQAGGMFKLTADPRITRVGSVLRKLSIDELPQVINILRGDMSVVGPRPALPREVELYDERALQRLVVRPGLTGLWQVSGRSQLTFQEMVDLDIAYWERWSLLRELMILVKTPAAVLAKKGAA